MNHQDSVPPRQGNIYTLAQTGTTKKIKPLVTLNGNGTELRNRKALKGRAKRKMITQTTVLSLVDIVKNRTHTGEQIKGYWNTYHCQSKVHTFNGRLYGKYCKNRHCTLCCSIRKADIINKYLPILQQWESPYFLTLSVKAVSKAKLYKRLRNVLRAFNKIKDRYRKRSQRGNSTKLIGIKSLECNFNPLKKTYNPHLHLIVASKEIADVLVKEWLILWTRQYAYSKGQYSKPVINKQKALLEIIKYGSKIFTEPDVNNKVNTTANRTINAAALNNILIAMKGLRIFERFGFDLPKQQVAENPKRTETTKYNTWKFDLKNNDWLNILSDEALTDYKPEYELLDLLRNRIDTELE